MEPQTTLDLAGQAAEIAKIGQVIWDQIIAFFSEPVAALERLSIRHHRCNIFCCALG